MGKFAITMMGFLLLCFCAEAVYMKYKDPKQPLNVRIRDLMNRMSLEEKIGQMTQIERHVASPQIMRKYFIGKRSQTKILRFYINPYLEIIL